jgi:NitT/TauT family transport system permease protein
MSAALASPWRSPRLKLAAYRSVWTQGLSLAAGLAIWQLFGLALHVAWLPPFTTVLAKLGLLWEQGRLQPHLLDSLSNLAIGYTICVVGGVGLGTLMVIFPKLDYALRPYVDALMLAPSIVLAPVLFVFLGLSRWLPVSVIIVYALVYIIANTYTAVSEVDRELLAMARSFGASRWQTFTNVVLPGSGPLLFAGLRIGLGRAVKGMINGELIITVVGLGALHEEFDGAFDVPGILAIALIVIIVALVTTAVLQIADRRVNAWVHR